MIFSVQRSGKVDEIYLDLISMALVTEGIWRSLREAWQLLGV